MTLKYSKQTVLQNYSKASVTYELIFPRPICLERCSVKVPKGYEKDVLETLKAFSNKEKYHNKKPHKLKDMDETYSLDVKSRKSIYRLLFCIENSVCKIIDLCTNETHR